MNRIIRTSAVSLAVAGLIISSGVVTAAPASASETGPTPTGMSNITAVSKNGKLALGTLGGRTVVQDVSKGKTVRRLGTRYHSYEYKDISDDGRYVLYEKGADIGVVDVKTGKMRSAVTTKSGARIKPAWKATACGEDCYDSDRPTVRGAMSGNGRYVTYCANFKVPTRGDLYIKDMRTKSLKVMTDVCPMVGEMPNKKSMPYTIDISETGQVILVGAGNETGLGRLVLNRSTVRALPFPTGPWTAQMSEDGSALYFLEYAPNVPGDPSFGSDSIGKRYDVATGAVTSLAADDPAGLGVPGDFRIPDSLTRRGRYVSYSGAVGPNSATGLAQIGVYDRQTGTTKDLTPALDELGLPRLNPYLPASGVQHTLDYNTLISGDGKTAFFGGWQGWYKVPLQVV